MHPKPTAIPSSFTGAALQFIGACIAFAGLVIIVLALNDAAGARRVYPEDNLLAGRLLGTGLVAGATVLGVGFVTILAGNIADAIISIARSNLESKKQHAPTP